MGKNWDEDIARDNVHEGRSETIAERKAAEEYQKSLAGYSLADTLAGRNPVFEARKAAERADARAAIAQRMLGPKPTPEDLAAEELKKFKANQVAAHEAAEQAVEDAKKPRPATEPEPVHFSDMTPEQRNSTMQKAIQDAFGPR